MCQGLRNALATLQRLMEKVLQGILMEQCSVFIHDVGISRRGTFEDHTKTVYTVFNRIKKARLTIFAEKPKILCTQVVYVSSLVNERGIRLD